MHDYGWLERLQGLAERFSYLGVADDMGVMDLTDLWGLYCFLRRLAEGA